MDFSESEDTRSAGEALVPVISVAALENLWALLDGVDIYARDRWKIARGVVRWAEAYGMLAHAAQAHLTQVHAVPVEPWWGTGSAEAPGEAGLPPAPTVDAVCAEPMSDAQQCAAPPAPMVPSGFGFLGADLAAPPVSGFETVSGAFTPVFVGTLPEPRASAPAAEARAVLRDLIEAIPDDAENDTALPPDQLPPFLRALPREPAHAEVCAPPAADAAQPRWSEDETAVLVAGFKAGHSAQDIADQLGRPVVGVRQKIKRLRGDGVLGYGVKAEPKPAAPKATQAPRWSEAEDATAMEMKLAGASVREIAAALGRPEPATQMRFRRHLNARREADARAKPAAVAASVPTVAANPVKMALADGAPEALAHEKVMAPATPKVAPVAAPKPEVAHAVAPPAAVAPPFEPGKPAWRRKIESYLDFIGNKAPWTAALDLALVEGLAKGVAKELLADQLGVEIGAIKARFIALTPDGPGIEYQKNLLTVLRERAGGAA